VSRQVSLERRCVVYSPAAWCPRSERGNSGGWGDPSPMSVPIIAGVRETAIHFQIRIVDVNMTCCPACGTTIDMLNKSIAGSPSGNTGGTTPPYPGLFHSTHGVCHTLKADRINPEKGTIADMDEDSDTSNGGRGLLTGAERASLAGDRSDSDQHKHGHT
jgi:hypothetical protein